MSPGQRPSSLVLLLRQRYTLPCSNIWDFPVIILSGYVCGIFKLFLRFLPSGNQTPGISAGVLSVETEGQVRARDSHCSVQHMGGQRTGWACHCCDLQNKEVRLYIDHVILKQPKYRLDHTKMSILTNRYIHTFLVFQKLCCLSMTYSKRPQVGVEPGLPQYTAYMDYMVCASYQQVVIYYI